MLIDKGFRRILTYYHYLKKFKPFFWVIILLHLISPFIFPQSLVTCDFRRNLFYGEQFWTHNFQIYDKKPLELDPNYDLGDPSTPDDDCYPNTTFDYPTIQLLFWAIMSQLPFNSVTARWVLSSIDIINFFLFSFLLYQDEENKEKNHLLNSVICLTYLFFSIPFSAVEGQSTAGTVLSILLPLIFLRFNRSISYITAGIGFHWKYVAIITFPYLLLSEERDLMVILRDLILMISGMVLLSFPLLVSKFILRYFGFFGNLEQYSGQIPSNPMVFNRVYLSNLISFAVLLYMLIEWIGRNREEMMNILDRSYWMPLIILLGFLKIYNTAFPWYWMWFYPLITVIPTNSNEEKKNNRMSIFISLMILFTIGTIDFIHLTVGLNGFIEFLESIFA